MIPLATMSNCDCHITVITSVIQVTTTDIISFIIQLISDFTGHRRNVLFGETTALFGESRIQL